MTKDEQITALREALAENEADKDEAVQAATRHAKARSEAKVTITALRKALEWYEERARQMADNKRGTDYQEAVATEIILDGGKRGRQVLAATEPKAKMYGMPGHVFDGFYRVEGDLADRARWRRCPACNQNGQRDSARASNVEALGDVRCSTCQKPEACPHGYKDWDECPDCRH